MAGFNAETVGIEPMEWDFESLGGTGRGVVPEPSDKDMRHFQREFGRIQRQAAQLEPKDEDALKMSPEEIEAVQEKADKLSDEMDELVAWLTKGSPSKEQMASLSFRYKMAFSKWLMEQFNPETVAAGTKG